MSVIPEVTLMLVRNRNMLDDYALFYAEEMIKSVPLECLNNAAIFYEYLMGCEIPEELLSDYPADSPFPNAPE